MAEHIEVQVTCDDGAEADRIADHLVEQRLAACVQQVPIRSTYRWQGAVERDDEVLLLVKTRRALVDQVEAVVADLHSYDLPAVTAVDIVGGSAEYLAWIDAETS
ncbi:MAG: divalent-cation tolerance protein CutA [Ilumatobacter sp.]|uniref:divalent-cation tolerance protein CutA n=1 Tax=Ilumatobacter sp. TaxID=1967498 RepID=UPI00261E6635|nr:divalent-cation tolerance protein CutA [Ilumatobacter sp.]MDJ0768013.1 divalent-cation tolerance protein CutA [Ilumatobacter sp.]